MLAATLAFVPACKGQNERMAQSGDIVSVHFTGRTAEGEVFETTRDGEPRPVHIGANLLLPAFEQSLIGMKVGEKKTFTVKSDQAFGARIEDETMLQVNYKSNQPHAIDYQVGQKLTANIEYPDGGKAAREVTIVAVDDKTFTVDANHPLAGKDLSFEVEIVGFE